MPKSEGLTRFTSESVTEGHPDKVADQVSDAILDAILAKDPLARVACETTVTTGLVLVSGEITTDCYVDIPRIIRATLREVGYTRAEYGFDAETCGVLVSIDGAGASHDVIDYLTSVNTAARHGNRGRRVEYSGGCPASTPGVSGSSDGASTGSWRVTTMECRARKWRNSSLAS